MSDKLYKDKKWLHQKYIVEKLPTLKIAKICGCTLSTICNWLKKYNIKARTRSEARTGELNPRYCPLEERLWKNVDKKDNISECWPWLACKKSSGHGIIGSENGGRNRSTHAVMYEVFYKDKIEKGECVHHLCENKSCCNPFHLVKMTHGEHSSLHQKENNRSRGEKNGNVKLTWKKIREIRKKYATGKYTQRGLAREYNIGKTTIYLVVNNKIWKK